MGHIPLWYQVLGLHVLALLLQGANVQVAVVLHLAQVQVLHVAQMQQLEHTVLEEIAAAYLDAYREAGIHNA